MSIFDCHVQEQEIAMQSVNIFGGVYSMILSAWNIEYDLAMAKYENDIFSLFETSNEFIYALCLSKIHFHQPGPFD